MGSPGGSVSKASAHKAGDPGLIPGSGRSPVEGNGKPLQHSVHEIPQARILEKEMASYSSILAWGISWTEEPSGLQSMAL